MRECERRLRTLALMCALFPVASPVVASHNSEDHVPLALSGPFKGVVGFAKLTVIIMSSR